MVISTHYDDYWYEVDDQNRIFRCSEFKKLDCIYINKVLLSYRDTKKQAIKLAKQFAKEFNYGIEASD